MKPDSLEQTLGCRGTALFSGKFVRMTPIGLNVMVFWSLSAFIDFVAGELFSGCSLHPTHLKSVNKFRMIFKSVWCTYDNAVICFLKKNMNSMFGSSFEIGKLHSTHRKFLISFRAFDSWFWSSSAKLAVILNTNSILIQFNAFFWHNNVETLFICKAVFIRIRFRLEYFCKVFFYVWHLHCFIAMNLKATFDNQMYGNIWTECQIRNYFNWNRFWNKK